MRPKHKLPPWLAARKRQQDMIIGVVWYTASEWAKTKASATDPDKFEENYEEWLHVAETAFIGLTQKKLYIQQQNVVSRYNWHPLFH